MWRRRRLSVASADLSPSATRDLLGKVLPQAPSDKAIRRVIEEVGRIADEAWEEVEYRVAEEVTLPEGEDDLLVVSVDGVNVPMREASTRTGRPAERPGVRESRQTPTAWREAGVGTISIYRSTDRVTEGTWRRRGSRRGTWHECRRGG